MEYSIKDVSKNIEITEQGLYKRINNNFDAYYKKGFITTKLVEQPSGTRKQIFLTKEGIKDLLKTKQLKETCINKDFLELNQNTKPVEQPTKPSLEEIEQQKATQKKESVTDATDTELLKVLNQTIADLKTENKRLNEKLDKQEERFDAKMEAQKQEFKEQFQKQQELYQMTLDRLMNNFNTVLQRLPEPTETQAEEEQATEEQEKIIEVELAEDKNEKGVKGFFKKLFNK